MGANRVDASRTGLFTPRCQLTMRSVSAPGASPVPRGQNAMGAVGLPRRMCGRGHVVMTSVVPGRTRSTEQEDAYYDRHR